MQRMIPQLARAAVLQSVFVTAALSFTISTAMATPADPSPRTSDTQNPPAERAAERAAERDAATMPAGHREYVSRDLVDAARAYLLSEQLVPFTTPRGTLTSDGQPVVGTGRFWVGSDSHRMHYVLANLAIESYYTQHVAPLEVALQDAQREHDNLQQALDSQRDQLAVVALQRDALQQKLAVLTRESSQRIAMLERQLEAELSADAGNAPAGTVVLGPHPGATSSPTNANAGQGSSPGAPTNDSTDGSDTADPDAPGDAGNSGAPEGPEGPEGPGGTGQAVSQSFVAPPDTRPIVVFNMFNGDNAPGDEFEYGRHNNVTSKYKNVEGVENLKQDIIEAAELGFRRILLHTVIGGKSGYFISGNGRWAIPPQKWDALGKMIEELTEMYPDIEIGPHFACLYTDDLDSAWGPQAGMPDEYYEQFPRLVGESEAERAFWAETRDAWRNVGATWMSGDNWLSARTRERAVEVIQEEWNERQFRIIGEAIPVNTQTYEPAAAQADAWVLTQTMVQRTALVGSNYPQTIAAVPEEVRGHWYIYHWINQWPTIPGAEDDPDAIAILAQKGWIVMHHDPEILAEGYQQAGISIETGEPYVANAGEGSQVVNEPTSW